jgi:hypothetical protein
LEAWQSILALFLVYAVTLSLFPGVLAEDLKVGHDDLASSVLRVVSFAVCILVFCFHPENLMPASALCN